jgi:hypothetical protein
MKTLFTQVMLFFAALVSIGYAQQERKEVCHTQFENSASFDPVVKPIEGWTVPVEPALLEGDPTDIGSRALRMLADHLNRISPARSGRAA